MITQMKLPFELNALEPSLTKEEVDLHYNKHHKSYIDNLNKLVKGTTFEDKTVEQIIKGTSHGTMYNNAAQIWNHDFYWRSLSPTSKWDDSTGFHKAVIAKFGSVKTFEKKFKDVATKCFGSGWTWIVANDGELELRSTKNAENFVGDESVTPLLVCDVWEHAYLYQKEYFADRGAYVEGFFKIANWEFAAQNFEATK